MLTDDEREQRRFHSVGLAAEPAIAIFAAIQIVRRESDEAPLRQARRDRGKTGSERVPIPGPATEHASPALSLVSFGARRRRTTAADPQEVVPTSSYFG